MDSRGRGSFSFCRRITSVLSSKRLDLRRRKQLEEAVVTAARHQGERRSNLQVGHLTFIFLREEVLPVGQDVFDQVLVCLKSSFSWTQTAEKHSNV